MNTDETFVDCAECRHLHRVPDPTEPMSLDLGGATGLCRVYARIIGKQLLRGHSVTLKRISPADVTLTLGGAVRDEANG